jgi:hypothetical protein
MEYAVVGVQRVDYKNKEGKQIIGMNYHCTTENKNIQGLGVEKIYLSDHMADNTNCPVIKAGDIINVLYNRYGSVESIELVKK